MIELTAFSKTGGFYIFSMYGMPPLSGLMIHSQLPHQSVSQMYNQTATPGTVQIKWRHRPVAQRSSLTKAQS